MFNQLSASDFEELTFDLLVQLGFVNVSWRRGTGKAGHSADQGRDVVAQLLRREVDDTKHFETWFAQCKHYKRGVPPEALQDAVAWAVAERPSVLLIVASNFLSNSAKNWIENYERNNQPPFRLKLWERKDLERLLSSSPTLVKKYNLGVVAPSALHPAHQQYVQDLRINSLDFFFEVISELGEETRDDLFSFSFNAIVNPRFRKPETGDETLGELMIDEANYEAFRDRCYELSRLRLSQSFLVQAIVSQTLGWAYKFGDPERVETTLTRQREAIAHVSTQLETETDNQKRATLESAIEFMSKLMESVPDNQRTWAGYYQTLCESVLPRLALEEPMLLQDALSSELFRDS